MTLHKLNQSGIAHLALAILVVFATIIGFVGYNVYQNNSSRADSFDTSTEGAIDCLNPDTFSVECGELLPSSDID